MEKVNVRKQDEILMSLVHFFVTKEGYTPIFVQGVKDEIWLENIDGPYRIIRINSNYIHNEEQYKFDQFKIKNIVAQIKKKTLSFKVNALNIELNVSDRVHFLGVRTDVPTLLKAADIVVMSSHFEGLSLSNIEGMAAGKPFVASDVDGIPNLTL